ncbi:MULTISPECIES: hypothetical protein [unclassified Fibrobacter]|uniref:hypothetical protein n=1 Tax=unclassified Fibrobacter TaxID=2634177 RepID=UPI000D6A82F9|nr:MULTISPECIES: hypothetical protein [unclassified Fibrobacter]PWJ70164.1 hypothetical protein BGX12_103129 [Fibrobacter sp. UWR4]PZW73513.1 hypothetical protein C8E88_1003131 [Fibrobacter sp. UWR1]
MNTEDILKFENNDGNEVHLVRDRLFWQAWEHSAFLFSKYFLKYQPHHKFIQKVAKDLVYLGFPKNVLSDLQLTSKQKGFVYEVIDDDHIVIRNVPNVDGYDEWKSGVLSIPKSTDQPKKESKSTPKEQKKEAKTSEYLLYRLVFDFTVYSSNLVPKINRIYRFPIGERLLNALVDVTEHVYLYINHVNKLDCDSLVQSLLRIRLDFRLLNELHQVSLNQWMFVNQKIEEILKIVSPESLRSRTQGVSNEESSILPATSGNG